MSSDMTPMTDTKKYGQYFDPDSTIQKMDAMVKKNGKDHYKQVIDPETKGAMDPAKVAAIIQRAELGNKRLDVLIGKLDSMPPEQGLSAKDNQTLVKILNDVKSSRPNPQEKQTIDDIVQTINRKGSDGLSAQETHQILGKMDSIRHDQSFFDPAQVKKIANGIDNKISQLKAVGKSTQATEKQKQIMDEIAKLNDVGKEVKESESTGMSEKEAQKVLEELKSIGPEDKEEKKDKQEQREEKNENEEDTENPSENLDSMEDEGTESFLEDGVEEGLGDAVVDGAGDVAAEAGPEVAGSVIEGAGGLAGAEGAALPEEVGVGLGASAGVEAGAGAAAGVGVEAGAGVATGAGAVELAALPEEVAVVGGAVGAAAI